MECNRDEAERAKQIAEKKFLAKDIFGAKKFALKAQNLFPGLKGISSMLGTLNVCIAAENKIGDEADWYGILGVDPLADEEKVRKQYRKLAIMLHPDKNKSVGADAAFKLISEAWSLLSDKSKRMAYDLKRYTKAQKFSPSGGPSVARRTNGMRKATKTSSNSNPQKNTTQGAHSSSAAAPSKSKSKTFWTVCRVCKMQYEYLRIYLNHKLLCPNCHEPFLAEEAAPPPSNCYKLPPKGNFIDKEKNSNHQVSSKNKVEVGKVNAANSHTGPGRFSSADFNKQGNFQWSPFSKNAGVSTAARAASMVQEAYAKVKQAREEAQSATKWKEASQKKQRVSKKPEVSSSGHLKPSKKRKCTVNTNMSSKFRKCVQPGLVNALSTQVDIQKLLVEKARIEICTRLTDMKSTAAAKTTVEEGGNGHHTSDEGGEKKLGSFGNFVETKFGTLKDKLSQDVIEVMSIDVPDPDFYDFDKDRSKRSFVENDVWAAYDDNDGMPRYYAVIRRVISLNPFKIRIGWLNSITDSDLASLKWSPSGITRTTGHFRICEYEISKFLNSFSHKMKWRKDMGGAIYIHPRRGDVWALYRNWSPCWNELTAADLTHKYEMVEVLEGYTEEHGVTVIPLVKVAGFKTVFHRHLDMREMKQIPREEVFRFSHYVPAHWLTGQEAPNAPKGCWELDPAATSSELLQIIRHVKEEDLMEVGEGHMEQNTVDNVKSYTNEDMLGDMVTCGDAEVQNIKSVQHVEIVSG